MKIFKILATYFFLVNGLMLMVRVVAGAAKARAKGDGPPSPSSGRFSAMDCTQQKRGRRCMVDIDFDLDRPVIFFETESGKRIKFHQKRKRGKGWDGSESGVGGKATIVSGTTNTGRIVYFGTFVDVEGDSICQLAANASSSQIMKCTNSSDFPEETEPRKSEPSNNRYLSHPQMAKINSSVDKVVGQARRLDYVLDVTIDVMVVWTAEAECRNSDLGVGCSLSQTTESNMLLLIQLAIDETNSAYQDSGIFLQLRLGKYNVIVETIIALHKLRISRLLFFQFTRTVTKRTRRLSRIASKMLWITLPILMVTWTTFMQSESRMGLIWFL